MDKTTAIDNMEEYIDSRDIIQRIKYLDSFPIEDLLEDEKEELDNLINLKDECEGYAEDWQYGVTLVRDSAFIDYAEELCKDVGDMPKELPWYIANHIDWGGVADELKMDYTEVDFAGITYWVR